MWGVQFHPEVFHSEDGTQMLRNFVDVYKRQVAVGILEAELQNQSLVAYFYQVRRYSGCVLRNAYVRHNRCV